MRSVFMFLTVTLCGWSASELLAATRTTFEGQIFGLSQQVRESFTSDPRLQMQSVALGVFTGEGDATGTNFGLRIEKSLKENLGDLLKPKARFTLAGSYVFVESEDPATPDAKVLVVTAQIKDDRGREVKPITVEINDIDGITQVLGLTAAIPQTSSTTFEKRNEQLQKVQEKPSFETIGGTRVNAIGAPMFSMGILKKSTFDGPVTAVAPENVEGKAFVAIAPGDYYEIELVNVDKIDVIATLTVDGLDVANTFATDKGSDGIPIRWPGYLIPAGTKVVIRGWLNTINKNVKDNVFSFRVVELGQGAATALKARGGVGVITVQLREACAPGSKLSGRSVGETAKGEGLKENMEARPLQIGDNVLSTVSIRYNRPQE